MSRQQLAERGLQQTVDLLQASKQLLDSYSNIQVDTQSQQQLLDVQQRYQQVSQDIRQTLLQCQALEEQEAAAAVAAQQQGEDPQRIAQLEAQAADLRRQVEDKNQLIKQVIDKLRHLVDAFNMWDSHERYLVQQSAQVAPPSTGTI